MDAQEFAPIWNKFNAQYELYRRLLENVAAYGTPDSVHLADVVKGFGEIEKRFQ